MKGEDRLPPFLTRIPAKLLWIGALLGLACWCERKELPQFLTRIPAKGPILIQRGRKLGVAKCHLPVTFREYFHNRKKYGNESSPCKFDILWQDLIYLPN